MAKFVPTLVNAAVGFEFKCVAGAGAKDDVVGDRYCNGKVDV
jgi:hypothetical protein